MMIFFNYILLIYLFLSSVGTNYVARKKLILTPACDHGGWLKQLYLKESETCLEPNFFRVKKNEHFRLKSDDSSLKVTCKLLSDCQPDEFCSTLGVCDKKNNECLYISSVNVTCKSDCESSTCILLNNITKEIHCCPADQKNFFYNRCSKTIKCGENEKCTTDMDGFMYCKKKKNQKIPKPNAKYEHFLKGPLANFDTELFGSCESGNMNKVPADTEFCPGNPIPLGHEQKCFGAVQQDELSGSAHPSGVCFKGYYCPVVNVTAHSLPKKPYITRVQCDAKCKIPINWAHAFCDSKLGKIVFIGTEFIFSTKPQHDDHRKMPKPRKCSINLHCTNGDVCVIGWIRDEKNKLTPSAECLPNPLRPSTIIHANYLKDLMYLWLLFGFMAFLTVFGLLRRKKTFDENINK